MRLRSTPGRRHGQRARGEGRHRVPEEDARKVAHMLGKGGAEHDCLPVGAHLRGRGMGRPPFAPATPSPAATNKETQ